MEIIKVTNLCKEFRTDEIKTTALENINLDINSGEFLSIMGPSGCGKSTLLNIIGLLDTPTKGSVKIDGQETSKLTDRQQTRLRNEKLGFVFQNFHLIPSLNVIENVMLPLTYRSGVSDKESRERARAILEKVGLSHRLHHMPGQLSGGQSQRVAIARAIVGTPKIVFADEPTGNLDSKMGAEVMQLLHRLNKDEGTTIVMVTHNEEQALQTDRIVRLFDGRLV